MNEEYQDFIEHKKQQVFHLERLNAPKILINQAKQQSEYTLGEYHTHKTTQEKIADIQRDKLKAEFVITEEQANLIFDKFDLWFEKYKDNVYEMESYCTKFFQPWFFSFVTPSGYHLFHREWLTVLTYDYDVEFLAVTLTYRRGTSASSVGADKNIRHFLNKLNQKVLGSRFKRFNQRLISVPVLIQGTQGEHTRVDLLLEKPRTITREEFIDLINEYWVSTDLADKDKGIVIHNLYVDNEDKEFCEKLFDTKYQEVANDHPVFAACQAQVNNRLKELEQDEEKNERIF
jgi:hypothetical protein